MTTSMQMDRFSVTMEPGLGAAVRDAAERSGISVSGWLAQAAADRLRNDLLGDEETRHMVTWMLVHFSARPRVFSWILVHLSSRACAGLGVPA